MCVCVKLVRHERCIAFVCVDECGWVHACRCKHRHACRCQPLMAMLYGDAGCMPCAGLVSRCCVLVLVSDMLHPLPSILTLLIDIRQFHRHTGAFAMVTASSCLANSASLLYRFVPCLARPLAHAQPRYPHTCLTISTHMPYDTHAHSLRYRRTCPTTQF